MIRTILRAAFLALIRLFYRNIELQHAARMPIGGPAIVVANHPNGLLDPLLVRVALGRPLAFLAKSTLFGNALGRSAMAALDAIPVYRPKDGADSTKNEETFARARERLFDGGWLALFPEGKSHSEPNLQPLKTGAARIALSAEAERRFALGLQIVPIGLVYEDKHIFRSRVSLTVGNPIPCADLAASYASDARTAVETLTARIEEALGAVILEADTDELWRGFLAVAAWTSEPPTRELAVLVPRAQVFARTYRRLAAEEPQRAERIVRITRRFVRMLRTLGVRDPLALEPSPMTTREIVRAAIPIVTLWPFALIGAAFGWLPYRLVRPWATRLAKNEVDVVGTIKLLLGLAVLFGTYLTEAAAAAAYWGSSAGLTVLSIAPASGYVALRWSELLELRTSALEGWWLRTTKSRLADAVRTRRAALIAAVRAELQEDESGSVA